MGAVKDEIYKCDTCGNVAYMLKGGDGDLVCCGENMRPLDKEEAKEFTDSMPKPGSP